MQYVSLLSHLIYPSSAAVFANLSALSSREADKTLLLLEKEKLIRKVPGGNPLRYQVTDAARAKYLVNTTFIREQDAEKLRQQAKVERAAAKAQLVEKHARERAAVCEYLYNAQEYARASDIAVALGFQDVRVVKAILYRLKDEHMAGNVLGPDDSGLYWYACPAGSASILPAPMTKPVAATPAVAVTKPVAATPAVAVTKPVAATPAPAAPLQRVVTMGMIVEDCAVFFRQMKADAKARGHEVMFYDASDVQDMPGMFYRKNVLRSVISTLLSSGVLVKHPSGYGYTAA